jgi:hypothetical protein
VTTPPPRGKARAEMGVFSTGRSGGGERGIVQKAGGLGQRLGDSLQHSAALGDSIAVTSLQIHDKSRGWGLVHSTHPCSVSASPSSGPNCTGDRM